MSPELEQRIRDAHRHYVLNGGSVDGVEHIVGMSGSAIRIRFAKMDLPMRSRAGKFTDQEVERICCVHDLQPHQVVGAPDAAGSNLATSPTIDLAAKASAVGAPTPAPQHRPTATLTDDAVQAAHGRFLAGESLTAVADDIGAPWQSLQAAFRRLELPMVRPAALIKAELAPPAADLTAQLNALQQLLATAQAQRVNVTGKISLQLSVEVDL